MVPGIFLYKMLRLIQYILEALDEVEVKILVLKCLLGSGNTTFRHSKYTTMLNVSALVTNAIISKELEEGLRSGPYLLVRMKVKVNVVIRIKINCRKIIKK